MGNKYPNSLGSCLVFFFFSNADGSSADPTEPGKMNTAFIYGPLIGVLLVVLILFASYRIIKLKRRNRKFKFV